MMRKTIAGPQGVIVFEARQGGKRLPVLFVHGDSCVGAQWHPVMSLMDGSSALATFDLRGHGDSNPARNGDYSYDGRARDLSAVAYALQWEKFIVVAHNGGSAVALAYDRMFPERVAGILMVDPLADPRTIPIEVREGLVRDLEGPNSLETQKKFYGTIVGDNAATREQVLSDVEKVSPEARLGVAKTMTGWNPVAALDGVATPIHCLLSDAGDSPGALYHLQPAMTHEVVHGTGHWIHLDRPDVVGEAVTQFVMEYSD